MAAGKEAVGLSRVQMYECRGLGVSCPSEIIAYYDIKHTNTTRMHTLSSQFIPLIYDPLRKRILSNIQPTLPFHLARVFVILG